VLCVHGSPSCYSSLHQCHPPAPCSPTGPSRTRSIRMPACLRNLLHRPGRLRLGGRGGTDRRRYLAEGQRGGATTRPVAAAVPPAPRCLPNATRRGGGLFAHAEACGFGHRSRHRTPISGSIKYRVLTPAKGRCECCGADCGFCALEASGRVLLENALGAVHRRCRSGDAWPQPGDLAAAWGGWVGVAPAGMERAGGAASPHCP
jgi:hypothetical protein